MFRDAALRINAVPSTRVTRVRRIDPASVKEYREGIDKIHPAPYPSFASVASVVTKQMSK